MPLDTRFLSSLITPFTPHQGYGLLDLSPLSQATANWSARRDAKKQAEAALKAKRESDLLAHQDRQARLKLDQEKFGQQRREFFGETLKDVQSDVQSGVGDRQQQALIRLRSAGGAIGGVDTDSIGRTTVEPKLRKAEQADPWADEPAASPFHLKPNQQTAGPVSAPVPPTEIGKVERDVVSQAVEATGFEPTIGMRFQPGQVTPKPVSENKPLPGPDSEVVGTATTAEGESVPLRVGARPPVEMTTRAIYDPFGNEVGVIRLGSMPEVVDRAMSGISKTLEAYSTMAPEIPVQQLEASARSIMQDVLMSYDGTLKEATAAAQEQISEVFGEAMKNQRAESVGLSNVLGINAANKSTDMKRGMDTVQKLAVQHGLDLLPARVEKMTTHSNAIASALSGAEKMSTLKFAQLKFDIAKENNGGGKLSDQDFARSVGVRSLTDRLKEFLAGNLSLTEDEFNSEYISSGGVLGEGEVSSTELEKFQLYLLREIQRQREKQRKFVGEVSKLYDSQKTVGAYSDANGIAIAAQKYGLDLPVISPLEAMQSAANLAQAARAQGLINQQHQTQMGSQPIQPMESTPGSVEDALDALGL